MPIPPTSRVIPATLPSEYVNERSVSLKLSQLRFLCLDGEVSIPLCVEEHVLDLRNHIIDIFSIVELDR